MTISFRAMKPIAHRALPLLCIVAVAATIRSQAQQMDHLYRNGEEGYQCFRIPAIIVTVRGTLLAFAEGRRYGCDDTGDIDLVVKRSVDGGKTWSDLSVVWHDEGNTCGNPSPVVDQATGRVCLLSTWNLGTDHEPQIIEGTSRNTRRVFILTSVDDGITWSPAQEITKEVKRPDWTWYATGPGNGIQVHTGKFRGRLIVPCDHIEAASRSCYSHTIYSDDGGHAWHLGGSTPGDRVNESTVTELADGALLLNMRNYGPVRIRQTSTSTDGGDTWSGLRGDTTLIEPVCQASLIRFDHTSRGPALAFSNPASRSSRINMTVRISYDQGRSWPLKQLIYPGPSAYSNLVLLPNGNLACVFEAGLESPYEGIVFRELSYEDFEPSAPNKIRTGE